MGNASKGSLRALLVRGKNTLFIRLFSHDKIFLELIARYEAIPPSTNCLDGKLRVYFNHSLPL